MTKRLMNWDDKGSPRYSEGLVWWSRLDNRYQIEVHRDKDTEETGHIHIFDHKDDNKELFDESLGAFMYGAAFGPDMEDIALWEEKAIELVDSLEHKG